MIMYSIVYSIYTAPYGIFARSCIAMAKDSRSTFNIIDDEGYDQKILRNSIVNLQTSVSPDNDFSIYPVTIMRLLFLNRCPVEPSIFPKFEQTNQYSLFAEYEAFRFTESYGVIFQCNVKYCLGPCPAVSST